MEYSPYRESSSKPKPSRVPVFAKPSVVDLAFGSIPFGLGVAQLMFVVILQTPRYFIAGVILIVNSVVLVFGVSYGRRYFENETRNKIMHEDDE